MRVAVFPCGTEIGLEIGRSLRFEKDIELFGLSSIECHGRFIYDNYTDSAPYVTSADFLPWLERYKRDNKIDLVIPANDLCLEEFAAMGLPTYHPEETIRICGSKSKTYEVLKDVVRVPKQYTSTNYQLPCFLKPDKGHSGIGCVKVESDAQFVANYSNQLILEYCEGDEVTIDCFTQNGELIYEMPRVRGNIRSGISANTYHVEYDCDAQNDLLEQMQAINYTLKFNGAWFCQFKRKEDKFILMEVAARIGGSSGSSKTVGVNLPLMDIYNFKGKKLNPVIEEWEPINPVSRSLSVKSELPEGDIYIDLDDTLILKGKVNWQVMALIYKYQDRNFHICTRNSNPYKVLDQYRVPLDLFKSICIVKRDQRKSDYVKGLLIDDSYNERKDCLSIDPNSIDLYL